MTALEPAETFRDRLRKRVAPWLQRGNNEKLLYTLGVHLDAFGDALIAAVKLRFPGLYSSESIPYIGRERRIPRGLSEGDAAYVERLRRWRIDHRRRGGPYAMLAQLWTHYAPNNFPIDLVYYSGRRFLMDVAGNVERTTVAWWPDSNAAKWARWWLFYQTDQWVSDEPTAAEREDLLLIPRQWNAAHPLGSIVLYSSGSELWNYPPGHEWNEGGVWNTAGVVRFLNVDDEV